MGKSVIERAADNIRILAVAMVEKAKSGHPGGAMGGADFINILYSEFLRFDPDDMLWPFRDRFGSCCFANGRGAIETSRDVCNNTEVKRRTTIYEKLKAFIAIGHYSQSACLSRRRLRRRQCW